ncbi:hypothetical protein [Agrobacterium vitis]|uniref:hypothetical protein n=1 Tax=Agrobacterium vitis TaxID=373 RepID=UPI0015717430|nr:hypothetical protein [Agrobacterium vitis]NSZ17573.1 hypothetical protein [Agrobacterium vitis]QZO03267.1 hypothetical protein K4831_12570 [Agrobacterium vitis]UJL88387.1 hypothetical protein AVF2S5_10910 [Agrobacterium vitis]
MHDGNDGTLMIELHKLGDQAGEGLIGALYERQQDGRERQAAMADIIRLPGLHERPVSRTQHLAQGLRRDAVSAEVIDFPPPQWHRNAARRSS